MPWLGGGIFPNSLKQKGICYSERCSVSRDFAALNSLQRTSFCYSENTLLPLEVLVLAATKRVRNSENSLSFDNIEGCLARNLVSLSHF
jgi:hypothetical protein